MTKIEQAKDNQGENAINETINIYPKQICNSIPDIRRLKITDRNGVNIVTYGRDYEDICKHCGRKYKDHENIRYNK
jgi:hypothetical protein